ncbi:unnamed protein product [Penicillium palitans]
MEDGIISMDALRCRERGCLSSQSYLTAGDRRGMIATTPAKPTIIHTLFENSSSSPPFKMRCSIVNTLLFLAVSPLGVLARPVDPNDVAGQWDPSGQYRKGQWQNGVFVANNGDNRNNQNGQVEQSGQWRDNNNQNGQYNQDGQQNNQNGWTDSNGQWHANNQNVQNGQNSQNGQNGWTDANGQWHANDGTVQPRDGENDNEKSQNGWTDANGQWHANNQNGQNNQNGWTDVNGQWHANQKRQATPATNNNDRLNEVAHDNNNPQVTPSSQNSKYQSYGNYKNYGSYQNYPTNGQNQAQNKDTKAVTGQQE